MKIKAVVVICSLLILASIELCINAAAEPLVTGQPPSTVDQTAGATKLADAIKSNDYKVIPMIFTSYFAKGILIYTNPTDALQLTELLEQTVKTKLEQRKSLASLQNLAGQRFSKIIEDSKKILMAQLTPLGTFEEKTGVLSVIAELLSYDELVKMARTSHAMYQALLPEMERRKELIKYWTENEIVPITINVKYCRSIAFSHDGNLLALEENNSIQIVNGKTGTPLNSINKDVEEHWVSISFSPKSNKLAFSPNYVIASIWDVDKNEIVKKTNVESNIRCLVFSPDENTVAIGCYDGKIVLWNLITGEKKAFQAHDGKVRSIAYSPDGKKFVSGGFDLNLKVWDHDGKLINSHFNEGCETFEVVFSPDNETVTAIESHRDISKSYILLWNTKTEQTKIIKDYLHSISLSPDGLLLACDLDYRVSLLSLITGKSIKQLKANGIVELVRFAPNGRMIASYSEEQRELVLWKAKAISK